ncbi:MAG: diaminopimelate epimerase, partial [Woeseiaceae bacterium]|nr:diaminopimelate epimerase [Woeseiaceae bacterium]
MQVAYVKMHGTGNKILVVDQRHQQRPPPAPSQLRELASDATGPGFDQLMWVGVATDPAHKASYRVFNADGSEVQQCGNGVRCVARLLANETGLPEAFTLESPAGPVSARVRDDGQVTVSMGAPEFEPANIPFLADQRALRYPLEVSGQHLEILAVSMGNPHCVLQVNDVGDAPVSTLSPLLEHHPRFPERCNVGFMQIRDRAQLDLRV